MSGRVQTVASSPSQQDIHHRIAANEKRLSILMMTGYFPGHLYPITALGEELVKRGHNVTLCATVMEGSDLLPHLPHSYGINFISAGPDNLTQADYEKRVRNLQNFSMSQIPEFSSIAQWPMIKVRSKIDHIGVDQFDFIISDFSVNPVGMYYAELGKKVMIFAPLLMHLDATIPEWPSPVVPSSLSDNLTFVSRAGNMVASLLMRAFQTHVFCGIVQLDKAFERVLKDVNLIDIYGYVGIRIPLVMATAFGLEYPKTRFPLTEYVGPLMMSSFPPLEDRLVEWLNNKPNKSVIYIGMGATGFVTTPMAQVIISGILATDFSAVWALPMSDQAVLEGVDIDHKDRFFISKWIPRQTLFKHPTLVMTILHCAMNSVQESLYNSLPMVCVPHGFDHFDVATRVASAQVGIPLYSIIDSRVFTSENVTNVIETITGNKRYSEQANKLSKIFRFAGGARRASDLVEFYAEVGYDHLIPAYAKYEWSWVQYYNLDVYSLQSLLSLLLIYSAYRLIKCCCKCCCSSTSTKTKME